MSVTTGFPFNVGPLNNIQPFTYRDQTSHMAMLEKLRVYINDVLRPEFNDEMQRIIDKFQEGLTNAENTVTNSLADWTARFDQFMEDVTAEIALLNDEAVKDLLNDALSETGVAIRQLFGWEFNIRHYGAVGDNTANDVAAIRAALAAAGTAATLNGGQTTVIIPPGKYRAPRGSELTWVFPGDGQFSKRFFDIPANVRIKGEGGVITYDCDYDNRAVIFYVSGSNVTIDGLRTEDTYNMAGGSRPTGIPVAGGDAYDATFEGVLSNVNILNCEFKRPWYPTKFGMTKDNGEATISGVHITNCASYGEPTSVSSGGFNFVSKGPGRVKDVSVVNSRCYDVTVSAAIGLYGIHDFVVTGNYARGSNINGGGIQTENGAFNGTISGNTLVDHYNHVWLDDSNDIVVSGNKMSNSTPDNNFKAVRMTYQGFDNDISHKAGDFTIVGNNAKNSHICTESFSNPQAGGVPTMGDVTIANNTLHLDGSVVQIGIRTGSADSVNITGNIVKGASVTSIRLAPNTGQEVVVTGNTTKKIGAETSVGLDIITANAVHPLVSNNRFANGIAAALTYVSARIGDMKIISGIGAPAMSGNPGDLYTDRQATLSTNVLYVKSDVGLLGWTAK